MPGRHCIVVRGFNPEMSAAQRLTVSRDEIEVVAEQFQFTRGKAFTVARTELPTERAGRQVKVMGKFPLLDARTA